MSSFGPVVKDCSNLTQLNPSPKHTGCHTNDNTAKTDRLKQEGGQHFQPYRYSSGTVPCDLRPFYHFSSNSRRSFPGGYSASIWNMACCIWNRQVETDAATQYNQNWPVKARGRSAFSTLPLLKRYLPLWPPAFLSLQFKQQALIS